MKTTHQLIERLIQSADCDLSNNPKVFVHIIGQEGTFEISSVEQGSGSDFKDRVEEGVLILMVQPNRVMKVSL